MFRWRFLSPDAEVFEGTRARGFDTILTGTWLVEGTFDFVLSTCVAGSGDSMSGWFARFGRTAAALCVLDRRRAGTRRGKAGHGGEAGPGMRMLGRGGIRIGWMVGLASKS